MSAYEQARHHLMNTPRTWLITGVAGFIGSNLLEALLNLGQEVVGLDNFATGHRQNLADVHARVSGEQWAGFRFVEGDIRDAATCRQACDGVDIVLHQAALGSVPRSLADPLATHHANLTGFLNMLVAGRDAGVGRFVYAASSSTYGNHPELPKKEHRIGRPLSPYAVTKYAYELYADVFHRTWQLPVVGLRYFNVFGPRQDPNGAYAAVVPRWFNGLLEGGALFINGDGQTSRDFCYIENCIQANLLAATNDEKAALGEVFNVAFGERTTLNELFGMIRDILAADTPALAEARPEYRDFRPGDVRHSLADVSKARRLLGYRPQFDLRQGLEATAGWYREQSARTSAPREAMSHER